MKWSHNWCLRPNEKAYFSNCTRANFVWSDETRGVHHVKIRVIEFCFFRFLHNHLSVDSFFCFFETRNSRFRLTMRPFYTVRKKRVSSQECNFYWKTKHWALFLHEHLLIPMFSQFHFSSYKVTRSLLYLQYLHVHNKDFYLLYKWEYLTSLMNFIRRECNELEDLGKVVFGVC